MVRGAAAPIQNAGSRPTQYVHCLFPWLGARCARFFSGNLRARSNRTNSRASSGMYVRLAFAVAAHLEPEILLIDEVLAVGDAQFQKKSLEKMEEVATNDGRTIIFVSDSMPTVARLCPRTIWLRGGQVAVDGPSEDVIQKYSNITFVDQGRVSWPDGFSNAGVHEFKFTSVGLLGKNGRPTTSFDYSEPLNFELSYTVHDSLSFCRIGFRVHGLDGTPIFGVYDVDEDIKGGRREPGSYIIRCEVPGDLLKPGRYSLSFAKLCESSHHPLRLAFVAFGPFEMCAIVRQEVDFD